MRLTSFRGQLADTQGGLTRMLKGFQEFVARGRIIEPLINRSGAGGDSGYGPLRIDSGGGQTIDFNVLLSAAINFVLVAAVVYFLVVVPYNRLRKKGEVEQAQDTELTLLTEIRNLMKDGVSAETVTGPGTGPSPATAKNTSGDR